MAVIDELIREEETGALSFGILHWQQRQRRMAFSIRAIAIRLKLSVRLRSWKEMECLYMNLYLVQLYMTSARQIRQ